MTRSAPGSAAAPALPHSTSTTAHGHPHAWRTWGLGWAGLGLLLGTLAFAPARWLAVGVAHASNGQLQLLNARGTVWQGQADPVFTGGAGSQTRLALPGGLRWTLRPGWDTQPVLRLQLQAPCCTPQGMDWTFLPGLGRGTLALAAHQGRWPIEWLTGLGTPWNTLQLQGQLRLQTSGVRWHWNQGRVDMDGALQLDALDMASSLSTLKPLGSYRLTLAGALQSPATLALSTLQGALSLSGNGGWNGGRLRFRGLAEAQADRVDALSNLLNILGRRDGLRAHMSLG